MIIQQELDDFYIFAEILKEIMDRVTLADNFYFEKIIDKLEQA